MPLADWMAKYPYVQALVQQPGDELLYLKDTDREGIPLSELDPNPAWGVSDFPTWLQARMPRQDDNGPDA